MVGLNMNTSYCRTIDNAFEKKYSDKIYVGIPHLTLTCDVSIDGTTTNRNHFRSWVIRLAFTKEKPVH